MSRFGVALEGTLDFEGVDGGPDGVGVITGCFGDVVQADAGSGAKGLLEQLDADEDIALGTGEHKGSGQRKFLQLERTKGEQWRGHHGT